MSSVLNDLTYLEFSCSWKCCALNWDATNNDDAIANNWFLSLSVNLCPEGNQSSNQLNTKCQHLCFYLLELWIIQTSILSSISYGASIIPDTGACRGNGREQYYSN